MQRDNHNILSIDEIITQRRALIKKIDGKSLGARLRRKRKRDLKLIRQSNHFKPIPESLYIILLGLGRGKYRAIVVSTFMSLLWDGWKSKKKKKTKRVPSNKVMLTRRMMAQNFGMSQSTAGEAIANLVLHGIIIVAQKSVYSGKQGKNLGAKYRLPWMEKSCGNTLKVYWGLLISEAFLHLTVTEQAIIILLHSLHNRSKNRLTIRPSALAKFGIHRNRLPKYITNLIAAGLLVYVEDHDYEFAWIDPDGRLDFDRIKKISMHLTHTDPAPNSYQGRTDDSPQ